MFVVDVLACRETGVIQIMGAIDARNIQPKPNKSKQYRVMNDLKSSFPDKFDQIERFEKSIIFVSEKMQH